MTLHINVRFIFIFLLGALLVLAIAGLMMAWPYINPWAEFVPMCSISCADIVGQLLTPFWLSVAAGTGLIAAIKFQKK